MRVREVPRTILADLSANQRQRAVVVQRASLQDRGVASEDAVGRGHGRSDIVVDTAAACGLAVDDHDIGQNQVPLILNVAAVVGRRSIAVDQRQVRQVQRSAAEDLEEAVDLVGVDEGLVGSRSDDVEVVGDIEVAGQRAIFIASDQRQRIRTWAEDDRVFAGASVRLHDRRSQSAHAVAISVDAVVDVFINRVVVAVDDEARLERTDINRCHAVTVAIKDACEATLIAGGSPDVVTRIASCAAEQQGVSLSRTAVITQDIELRSDTDDVAVAPIHECRHKTHILDKVVTPIDEVLSSNVSRRAASNDRVLQRRRTERRSATEVIRDPRTGRSLIQINRVIEQIGRAEVR